MEKLDLYYFAFIYAGIGALILGIIIIIQTTIIYRQALDSNNWLSTTGNIRIIKVNHRKPLRIAYRAFYEAHVEYQYFVNGEEHIGTQQTIGNTGISFRNIEDANVHTSKFKEGQEVVVYYKSSKSQISSLSIGVDKILHTQFVLGFVFFSFGSIMCYLMIWYSRL